MKREARQPTKIERRQLWMRLTVLGFIVTGLIIFSACAGAPAATEAPPAPEAPEQPGEPGVEYPVQYGQDSRMEPFQHPDQKLIEMAASVAIFVHENQVNLSEHEVTLEGYTLNEMSELGWLVSGAQVPLCAEELFAAQAAPGFCTGFLVAEDLIVTAGHCLEKTLCSDTLIVFGFQMESTASLATVTSDDVFRCAEVIAQVSPTLENQSLDYALVRLDRPTGRMSLSYTTGDHLRANDQVAVLGYPSGLPLKIASNAFVLNNEGNNPYFVANLDTFGSNSGSPVVNMETYQVEGILVRGTADYILSQDGSCVQVNRCPEGGDANCVGENATKMGKVANRIAEGLAKPEGYTCFPGLLLAFVIFAFARLKTTS